MYIYIIYHKDRYVYVVVLAPYESPGREQQVNSSAEFISDAAVSEAFVAVLAGLILRCIDG